ncbi:hypothetical protein OG978_16825 [Streptomyces sp. NBC_01591]|uniref:hypothetical protein n=1 Tax=Streptomyces sp. NBC_01591 TaxID=2975888 RepID=UPI002DDB1F10|nr:hypothetical protein [Streptomyces sp. NBC_01591]WSD68917.1 hypothetical protein OG978_16825 [Streptomyces sp. NBC_01591]
MNPVIIGAIVTGSLALIGTIGAAVIATRTRPSQAPTGRRPSEAVMLFEIATATTKALAFANSVQLGRPTPLAARSG